MIAPHSGHFFNWDTFSLRQQFVYDDAHDNHADSKADKQTELQVTKHCREDLCDYEGEDHVYRNSDTLGS
jgi:hypothetical protein